MQLSKLIKIVFLFTAINAQQIDSKLYGELKSKGAWGDYYLLDGGAYKHIINDIELDSIYLIADNTIEHNILNRLFYSIKGSSNINQVYSQLNSIEEAYPFLNNASTISFAKYGKGRLAALMDVNPIFKSHFGGILGASRDNKGDLITTGELDIHLENMLNKGNIINLLWRQPDAESRLIDLSIEIPTLLNLPFGSIVSFNQEFYEKNYFMESNVVLLTFVGSFGKWKFGRKTERSRDFYLDQKFSSNSVVIGLKGDRRNNRWLPYAGKYWKWNLNFGQQNDFFGKTNILESYFQIDQYKSLSNSVLLFSIWGAKNWIDDRELSAAKKIKFGGSKLLRGYHDSQFASDWVLVKTMEWILGSLDRTQLFLFGDIPFSSIKNIKPGFGMGIRQYNGSISYDISVGFPGEFSTGKIHISFITDL